MRLSTHETEAFLEQDWICQSSTKSFCGEELECVMNLSWSGLMVSAEEAMLGRGVRAYEWYAEHRRPQNRSAQ